LLFGRGRGLRREGTKEHEKRRLSEEEAISKLAWEGGGRTKKESSEGGGILWWGRRNVIPPMVNRGEYGFVYDISKGRTRWFANPAGKRGGKGGTTFFPLRVGGGESLMIPAGRKRMIAHVGKRNKTPN